jgi:nicotinamide mononucleotide transporter
VVKRVLTILRALSRGVADLRRRRKHAGVSTIEAFAALLGLCNIVLIVRRSVWNYPFALAMVSLYAFIFWEVKLYSDAALQLFFFAINLYGWWHWRANAAAACEVEVRHMPPLGRIASIAAVLLATALWGWLMASTTDASYPWWDAGVAMGSIGAQILMARRYVENWHGWIAVNLASIPLYAVKELWLTAALYAAFLAIAIWGLIEWRRVHAARPSASGLAPA